MLTRDVAAAATASSKHSAVEQACCDSSTAGDDKQQVPVLQLQLFCQHPTVDFGSVSVGSHATHYLRAENPTLLTQHLSIDKVPVQDGFSLSADPSLPAAASLSWSSAVAPHSNILLPITWKPSAAGAVSRLIVFKLDDKHRLQVKLLGKAVVQYNQPTARQSDQSANRTVGQRGVDAAVKKPTASSKQEPLLKPAAAAAATAHKDRPTSAVPRLATGSVAASGSSSSTARASGAKEPPARFKAPTRSSASAAGSLKLKAGQASQADGAKLSGAKAAATAAATRVQAGPAKPSPWQEAAAGLASVPATPRSKVNTLQPSPACTPLNTAKTSRGISSSLGGISSSSSVKASSSTRKTFRFFHTELWMNKQDRAFTGWLNHLLMPYTPEYLRAASEGDTSAALSDLRLAARVQGAMAACYRTDEELRETMIRVEESIDAGKLRMKPEVVLMGDVQQRRQALEVLMSFSPFWLRLAVEVVTQKPLQLQGEDVSPSPGKGYQGGLAGQTFFEAMRAFLLQHFLADADMAAEMQAARGAAHYDMEQYTHELGQLVLKRFLLLVLLLDKAATHLAAALRTPLLFKLTASIKSSRQAVSEFLQTRLVGEGNVMRHLELLGYKLHYSQSPLMEYPFAITNLAVDLRDGLRLIKVAEVLTGDMSLLQQARFPCDRRPMQLHNTSLALSALQAAGVQLQALPTTSGLVSLKPEDVIDGDRERTLSLLWAVARTLQLGTVLKVASLKAEVQRVLARTRVSGRRPLLPLAASSSSSSGGSRPPLQKQVPLAVYMHDELLSTLQEWVQAVCAAYDVSVQNFTTCFADGVVLCLLVHYYLPNAIELQDVFITKQRQQEAAKASQAAAQQQPHQRHGQQQQQPSGDSHQWHSLSSESSLPLASSVCTSAAGVRDMLLASNAAAAAANAAAAAEAAAAADGAGNVQHWAKGGLAMEFDLSACGAPENKDEALVTSRGVAGNFRAVHRAAKALGAVPEMLSAKDFAEHGPDERAVILYVAFLCSRLLECSKDDRAAHIIQTAWRQNKAKSAGMARAHLAKWMAAATVVQRAVRAWLFRRRVNQWLQQQRRAALALQAAWRGQQVRQQQQKLTASCVLIQRKWRQALARRSAAATLLQSCWRGHMVRKHNGWMRRLLDRCMRAYEALKLDRQRRRLAAAVLQAGWRAQLARRQLTAARAAAVVVQAAWRGHQERSRYLARQQAAVRLQAMWRGRQARLALRQMQAAALLLQAVYRGWRVRQTVAESHAFAMFLQSCCRAARQRTAFLRLRAAASVLQAAVRGQQQRNRYQDLQQATLVLQSMQRGNSVRQQLQQQATAATTLQALWRGKAARAVHQKQCAAATQLQAAWRGFAVVRQYQQQRAAALALQAVWRGHQQRAAVAQQARAATTIAAAWRQHTASRSYAHSVQQVVVLQAAVRALQARMAIKRQRAAAVLMQSSWRGWAARQKLQQQQAAAVIIQSSWRGAVLRQELADRCRAATVLQAAVRCHMARQQYCRLRAAAILLQSQWRALQARRLLTAHKAAVVMQSHWRRHRAMQSAAAAKAAAVAIQAAWRARVAQQAYQQQQAAALVLQAVVRGQQARRQLRVLHQAAVVFQSSWRGLQARQLLHQHRAAQLIQAVMRGWLLRKQLFQQALAATTIRAAWLAHKQRQCYLREQAAVVALQASARMLAARQRFSDLRAAAVIVQAAFRGQAARQQYTRTQQATVTIQAAWRGYTQRSSYLAQRASLVQAQACWRGCVAAAAYQQQRAAATVLQCLLRGVLARQQLCERKEAAAAAIALQTAWRGRAARKAYRRQRRAAIVLQCLVRGKIARRAAQAERDYINTAKELQKMLLMLHTRSRAATTIQSAWRGWAQRRRWLPVWEQYVHQKQQLQAAIVLQQAWRCARARADLHERKAALPRQLAHKAWMRLMAAAQRAAWQQRLQEVRLQEAALTIQAAYRGWQVRRVTAKQLAGVRRFQALWRGYKVRKQCGRAGRDARRRLAAVAAAAEAAPQRRIGVRTREALDVLLASRQCSQVITAVAAIEFSTRYSKACCKLMVDSSGVSALLAFMRSCNRSKPHVEMLGHALACLANICRWPDLQAGVLMAPDCVMVLSERLQMFRDTEDIFMATVAILSVLVKGDEGALHVARSAPGAMKLWEGVCQLLGRKMDMERKYIERLEGQKGSDVTAREATRKMVAAATQLDALQQIVVRIDAIAAQHNVPLVRMARTGSAGTTSSSSTASHHQHAPGGPHHTHHHGLPALQEEQHREELVPRSAAAVVQPHMWQPKNTIVRSAYREVSSQVVAQRAAGPLAAAAAVAPVAPPPVVQSMAAAAAAAAAGVPASTNMLRTPRMTGEGGAGGATFAAGAAAGASPLHRDANNSLGGLGIRSSSSSSHNGSLAAGSSCVGVVASPARRPSSSSGCGRHSQPETPINCPLMVFEEDAAPEDTLMAAVQQLAEAQTPRRAYSTPRRTSRRASTGGG